jgi:hypothetical protein
MTPTIKIILIIGTSAFLALPAMQLIPTDFVDTNKSLNVQAKTADLLPVTSSFEVSEVKFDDFKELAKADIKPATEVLKLEALAYEKVEASVKVAKGSITPIVDTPDLKSNYLKYKEYYSADNTCHPYIIAALHYRETNFGNTNAWNGQGAFQNTRNRYVPNSTVEDFNEQVRQACLHLKGKVKVQTLLDPHNEDILPQAFAGYNGCAGFAWDKCSYVVNKTNLMNGGYKCAVDGCAWKTYDNKPGVLSILKQLISLNI